MAHRMERVNHLIRQEISELLRLHVKDPRLGTFVSVNEVKTTSDLRHAKIFVSSINGSEQKEETLAALASAAGYLRREMSQNLKLRRTPELSFQWDNSIEQGDQILRLMDHLSDETENN